MILKRALIIIGIMILTSLIGASLLLLGINNNRDKQVNIYDNAINTDSEESENVISEMDENLTITNDSITSDKQEEKNTSVDNVDKQVANNNMPVNTISSNKVTQSVKSDNITTNTNEQKNETQKTEENNQQTKQETKEDIYTFKRNDVEIQKMINIAKSIIRENKNGRCDGLVDKVDSINFIIGKAGNLFYPLFDYRIENIVIDNYYPEFYVYAEDIFLNGEYVRTEYYFN